MYTEDVILHLACSPCVSSVCVSKTQGTGKPALLGLLVLKALKIELLWPITCNCQLPETQILNLSVISFQLGKEGAVLQWQDLAFPLCQMHFLSISCGFPKV